MKKLVERSANVMEDTAKKNVRALFIIIATITSTIISTTQSSVRQPL